ncbi:helix-turn-helix domain-containing protein [Flavobacterium sp. 3HN19-14]|uniref:helix-turn-helix domain-containing protein n=1 Tax=Flavobacterium sp. 3HN19-14 TaxID=3448133 RepID=UPI003EE1ED70
MVQNTIKFVDFSKEEFISLIREAFEGFTTNPVEEVPSGQGINELLTREETSKLLKVSFTTLFHWNNDSTLPAHKIGRKVFYLRNEVMNKLNNAA